MSSSTAYSDLPSTYRKILKTWRPVILYFANEHCPACETAGPVFRHVAEPYRRRGNIYMLNTRDCPRHPLVTGTPTVLFYKNGKLLKKLKGIGSEESLKQDFAHHIGNVKLPAARHRRPHDLAWLCRSLRNMRTIPDRRQRRRLLKVHKKNF